MPAAASNTALKDKASGHVIGASCLARSLRLLRLVRSVVLGGIGLVVMPPFLGPDLPMFAMHKTKLGFVVTWVEASSL